MEDLIGAMKGTELRKGLYLLQNRLMLLQANLSSKGAPLKFIPSVLKEGKKVAKLDQFEVDKLSKAWSTAVILYVVGQTPSIGTLTRFIDQHWNHVGKPRIFLHDKGYFIIKFASIDDRNEILYARPHMINSRPMIIKAWSPDFDFQAEVSRVVPLWIRLYNLPLNFWEPESLSRIGSMIGVPLFADECTTHQQRITFARMLVEVDVTKDLTKSVSIEDGSGRVIEQKVHFEWAPSYCLKCNTIGHDCLKKKAASGKEGPKPIQRWVPKTGQPTIPKSPVSSKESIGGGDVDALQSREDAIVNKEVGGNVIDDAVQSSVADVLISEVGRNVGETSRSEPQVPTWNIVTRG
ncbi:uncharacterized protein LOC125494010 [Beta vulgaris subsp. vulgaris]|uniref:uncharacterized protein LOC125494010 n=1 Tax=Beta vulgaris subsp. vulgaris TaxID=3555 RepID=UPI002036EC05|nr:uncharacterized protein LOC125494010 [Beta vulgaris subsp. vulgaris]